MSTNLYDAHTQWAKRPSDERFWNLSEMYSALSHIQQHTKERSYSLGELTPIALGTRVGLQTSRGAAVMSHFSFGQYSQMMRAPAGYLRTLPAELAVRNLEHAKGQLFSEDSGFKKLSVLAIPEKPVAIRAINGPKYTRIPNISLISRLGDLGPGWVNPPAYARGVEGEEVRIATSADVVPGISRVRVGDRIAPSGLYASDRDMFVFLVHRERILDIGGETLARGMFWSNSEVGDGALDITTFLFDDVCGNHIVWDVQSVGKVHIRHVGDQVYVKLTEGMRKAQAWVESGAEEDTRRLLSARNVLWASEEKELVPKLQSAGLGKRASEQVVELSKQFEDVHRARPESVWGVVSGITRFSQGLAYQDEKEVVDRIAGKILVTVQ